jgi:hypothetical protein
MQFSLVVILAAFASSGLAAPTLFSRQDTCDIKSTLILPPSPIYPSPSNLDCVLDLAPSVVACGSAAAQLEIGASHSLLTTTAFTHLHIHADPVSDAGCLIAAAKDVVDLPPSCNGCLAQFGVSTGTSGIIGSVESGLSSAGSAISSGLSSLGSDISGLF